MHNLKRRMRTHYAAADVHLIASSLLIVLAITVIAAEGIQGVFEEKARNWTLFFIFCACASGVFSKAIAIDAKEKTARDISTHRFERLKNKVDEIRMRMLKLKPAGVQKKEEREQLKAAKRYFKDSRTQWLQNQIDAQK